MRVLHSLALLLFEPNMLRDQNLLDRLQSELRTTASSFKALVTAYTSLWRRFN